MGLDIYFYKFKNSNRKLETLMDEFYEGFDENKPLKEVKKLAEKLEVGERLDIEERVYKHDGKEGRYVTAYRNDKEQVMYFRKHNWLLPFFDYGDNCSYKTIHKEDLQRLVITIERIKYSKNPAETAEELMPTQSGFFFGSQDYDEFYFNDLDDELEQCKKCIEETDWEKDIVKMHCWW